MKKHTFPKFLCLLAAFAMVLSMLSGCGSTAASSASAGSTASSTASVASTAASGSTRDDIVVGMTQEPATLDPNNMGDGAGFQVAANIYESLLWINDDLEVEPLLAKSWDVSDDGLTYTFHLEENVTFHNGEPFTASDCKYTYDRAMAGGYASSVAGVIDSTEAVDDHTFQVTLKYPYAAALECFASHFLRIVNQKAVEAAGDKFSYDPEGAGTGPYEFVSWDSGSNIKLKAYDGYWRTPASIKNVEFRFIADSTTLSTAIETGEVDYGTITVSDIANFKSNKDLAYQAKATTIVNYLGFDTEQKPFDDARVRQAIAYCCDKDELLLISQDGAEGGTVTATPVPASGFGCNTSLTPYPKDVEKAKQLLADAGYPDGFTTTIYTPNANWRKNIATYMQSCMAEIGITANIEVMEQAALLEDIRAGKCPVFIMGFSGTAGDADFFYYSQYHSGQTYNYTRYHTDELDGLLDQARQSSDSAERTKLYQQISQIVYDDVPDMPNFFINFIYGYNAKLTATVAPFVRIYVYDFHWN